MRKRYIKNMLMTLVVVILTMSTTFALAEDKVNGFPLPTNKSYAVTVLSRYSGGGNHDSYLYTYGALKGRQKCCYGYFSKCMDTYICGSKRNSTNQQIWKQWW